MKLRFTPRATRDLAEIAEYLRTRNPSAALAVRDAILRSFQNLTLFPAIGPSPKCRRRPQTRDAQIPGSAVIVEDETSTIPTRLFTATID